MASRFIKSQEAQRNQENYNPTQDDLVQSSKPQRNNTPPLGVNPARAAVAATARVKAGTKQKSANTISAPHSAFPPLQHHYPAGENEYQEQQYYPEQQQMEPIQQATQRENPFEDTISTDWDQTKTSIDMDEIPFSQQTGTYQQGYNLRGSENDFPMEEDQEAEDETVQNDIDIPAFEERSPGLHRKPSRQYLKQHQQDMARHQANPTNMNRSRPKQQPAAHPNLQIRPGHEEIAASPKSKHSKKRGRSNEPLGHVTNNPRHPQRVDRAILQEDDRDHDFDIGAPSNFQNGGQDPESDEHQTPTEAPSSLDYTDEELLSMPYAKLQTESWEIVPEIEAYSVPKELSSSKITMEQKIESIMSLDQADIARAEFFAQMPSDEWQQAGDYILTNMMDLMKKMKEARDEKRRIAESFENQLEAREKAVRRKYESYDAKLKDMKASGEDVLRGKV